MSGDHPVGDECDTCGEIGGGSEELPFDCCPNARRPCGHHCNCIWVHDCCHWCNAEISEDGESLVYPIEVRS